LQSISVSIEGSISQKAAREQALKRDLRLFEIALVLLRLGHVASRIVNANQGIS